MPAYLPRYLSSPCVLGIYRLLLFRDQISKAFAMIFGGKKILACGLFHWEDCSEYVVDYSAGNGSFHSLICPLYMVLLSIRKENESLFFVLFSIMDTMNLKVCL